MDIHSLTSAHLKQAIRLLDKKEALHKQIAELDSQISDLLGGEAPAAARKDGQGKAKATKTRATKTRGRGALKESILAELKSAGAEGVSVKSLVEKLGNKSANLHAWFNMTGKNVPGIKKIGRGVYRLDEA